MTTRDDFPAEIKRILRERVGGWCSRPECGRLTVSPNAADTGKIDITGRAAHITAARPGGPRFNAGLTNEERRSIQNGIWLCADCADLIDKTQGAGFSVEQLRSWKRAAEDRQSNTARLRVRARRPAWLDRLGTPHYVNVPRVLHMVGNDALSSQVQWALREGFPRGRAIIRELVEVEEALRRMTVQAIDVRDIDKPGAQLSEGLVVSYHHQCRTKNSAPKCAKNVANYSFERSPLIYLDCNGYRYIQPYDPNWLTTQTAQASVRAGSCKLAGIAIIKSIDHSKKQVIASPLTFGIPEWYGLSDAI